MNGRKALGRLSIALALGGLVSLGASYWWGFELLTHFRVQYVVLAVPLAAFALSLKQRLAGMFLIAVAGINAWPLLPYLPMRGQDSAGFQFTILVNNVKSRNTEYSRIVDAIRSADADLVSILELTPELDHALQSLGDRYPYQYAAPANGNFGIGVLSRVPIRATRSVALLETEAIDTTVALPGGTFRFLTVHLVPPVGYDLAQVRNRQLEALAAYTENVTDPLVVCGDFNLTPYSPFFVRFAENASLRDVRRGTGFGISWPTSIPLLGIPIDHCFVRGPIAPGSIERLAPIGSDHYPVQVTLRWKGG